MLPGQFVACLKDIALRNTECYSGTPSPQVFHMPTLNPRINVTLSPSLDSLVRKLAEIQRVSKSSVLREFLEAVEPQLRQALALMEAAKGAKPNALRAVSDDMQTIVHGLEGAQAMAMAVAAGRTRDLVAEAEAIRGRRPARSSGSGRRSAAGASARPSIEGAPGAKRHENPLISNRGVKSLRTVVPSSVFKGSKS